MLTGEFRNTNHSRYLADEGPDAEWNPHIEMSKSFYIHFSDWPLPKYVASASMYTILLLIQGMSGRGSRRRVSRSKKSNLNATPRKE